MLSRHSRYRLNMSLKVSRPLRLTLELFLVFLPPLAALPGVARRLTFARGLLSGSGADRFIATATSRVRLETAAQPAFFSRLVAAAFAF